MQKHQQAEAAKEISRRKFIRIGSGSIVTLSLALALGKSWGGGQGDFALAQQEFKLAPLSSELLNQILASEDYKVLKDEFDKWGLKLIPELAKEAKVDGQDAFAVLPFDTPHHNVKATITALARKGKLETYMAGVITFFKEDGYPRYYLFILAENGKVKTNLTITPEEVNRKLAEIRGKTPVRIELIRQNRGLAGIIVTSLAAVSAVPKGLENIVEEMSGNLAEYMTTTLGLLIPLGACCSCSSTTTCTCSSCSSSSSCSGISE